MKKKFRKILISPIDKLTAKFELLRDYEIYVKGKNLMVDESIIRNMHEYVSISAAPNFYFLTCNFFNDGIRSDGTTEPTMPDYVSNKAKWVKVTWHAIETSGTQEVPANFEKYMPIVNHDMRDIWTIIEAKAQNCILLTGDKGQAAVALEMGVETIFFARSKESPMELNFALIKKYQENDKFRNY